MLVSCFHQRLLLRYTERVPEASLAMVTIGWPHCPWCVSINELFCFRFKFHRSIFLVADVSALRDLWHLSAHSTGQAEAIPADIGSRCQLGQWGLDCQCRAAPCSPQRTPDGQEHAAQTDSPGPTGQFVAAWRFANDDMLHPSCSSPRSTFTFATRIA